MSSVRSNPVPLEAVTSRPEAMERCIGPLGSLVVCYAIDQYQAAGSNVDTHVREAIERTQEVEYGFGTTGDRAEVYAIASAALFNVLDIREAVEKANMTNTQLDIFHRYIFAQNPDDALHEGLEAMHHIPNNYVIPAFLDCMAEISGGSKSSEHCTPATVSAINRRPDYHHTLHSLCIGPNGTFEDASSDDPMDGAYALYKESQYAKGFKKPTIQNLCERKPDGSIGPSMNTIAFMRALLKDDNLYGVLEHEQVLEKDDYSLQGSRGCPLALSTPHNRFRIISRDDFTDHQWKLMTQGPNPVVKYDDKTESYRLERLALSELAMLMADLVDRTTMLLGLNPNK